MFKYFAEAFIFEGSREDFVRLKDQSSGSLSNDTESIAFQKQAGKDVCIVRLINARASSLENYHGQNSVMQEKLISSLGRFYSRIFVADVFVCDVITDEIKAIINSGEEFFDQRIYSFQLAVSGEEIYSNHEKPNDICGLSRVLNNAIKSGKNGIHFDTGGIKATKPYLSYVIMALNAVMLVITYFFGGMSNETLISLGALEPVRVFRHGEYYRLFTVMLLHGGITHLISNCLGIYIFGTRVERIFGRGFFLFIYVISGLAGSFLSLIFLSGVAVGASGGIYGLVGASLMQCILTRRSLDGIPMDFLLIYSILSISLGFMNPQIGNAAHMGGFVSGLIICFFAHCLSHKKG